MICLELCCFINHVATLLRWMRSHYLGDKPAATFSIEFLDKTKAMYNYLSSICRKYSLASIPGSNNKAGMRKITSNCIPESNHASSIKLPNNLWDNTIRQAEGEGQANANNAFGRDHESLNNSKSLLGKTLLCSTSYLPSCSIPQSSLENKVLQYFDVLMRHQQNNKSCTQISNGIY